MLRRILIGAVLAVTPVLALTAYGAHPTFAAGSPTTTTWDPPCVVHSIPSFVESGEGATASSIADVITVECEPVYSEQSVTITSSQLFNLCQGLLTWHSDSSAGPGLAGTGTGPTFTVFLDNDGGANAIVYGGPSCAAGRALITADLNTAPFYTAKTYFTIRPPVTTPPGVYALPHSQVEDEFSSGIDSVIQVEYPSTYAGRTVNINDHQLAAQCHGNITFFGPEGAPLATGVDNADVTLDNNGNAFVGVEATGCSSGYSTVVADLVGPPYTTYTTTFHILSPRPTTAPER